MLLTILHAELCHGFALFDSVKWRITYIFLMLLHVISRVLLMKKILRDLE